MAKLILSMDGVTLKEIPLAKERTTIGRKPVNDIQIDNLAISGEHAAIITLMNDSFLEDLDSTNGTYVAGRSVKKHFLQDGDVIELAKYRLKYVSETTQRADSADTEKTVVMRPETMRSALEHAAATPATPSVPRLPTGTRPPGQLPAATIQVLNGNNAGKELDLTKTLTRLGKPGVLVAAIARRPMGYFITHVEGRSPPLVGGQVLEANRPHPLYDHDIIELAGIKMEFFLKA